MMDIDKMASHPTAPIVKQIGSLYSWLMKNSFLAIGLRSLDDAGKLHAAYGSSSDFIHKYDPAFAIAAIGYDPAEDAASQPMAEGVR